MSGAFPSSPIDIRIHDSMGGHTISNHVGKSQIWLRQRLLNDPTIPSASTFPDIGTADFAVNSAMRANLSAYYHWLSSGKIIDSFDHDVGIPIGIVMARNPAVGVSNPLPTTRVRVIVKKLGSAYVTSFYVRTAFPIA
jgi:hypothetical protein